ncbi:hypothetical protein JHD50_13240, partial [Sulfurimonas sp. MAG313]|nr:hypothetical protein [Sulfurimonas sp. MAG313]
IVDNSIENLNILAAYVTQVNTIFADGGGKVNSASTETVLLNAKYKVMDGVSVTGYGYLIENFGDTYGLSVTGKPKLNDTLSLDYRVEYAILGDTSFDTAGVVKNDASYYNVLLGVNMSGVLAAINYEVQSGDDTAADGINGTFSTPLGTNHGHNGWADKFLATPAQGLVDANIMIGYKSKDIGVFKALYHDFTSDVGSLNYGTEVDFLYKRSVPGVEGVTGMLKYANYSADVYSVDTQKMWVMLDYKFSN